MTLATVTVAAVADPHGAHIAVGFAALATVALVVTVADLSSRLGRGPTILRAAALLSGVAAAVHAAVVPHHLREATSLGLFFVATAVAQLAWATGALLRRSRPLLVLGVVGNLGLLALWALSRTVGLPLGPESGAVEPVGVPDLIASSAELVLVGLVCSVLASHRLLRVAQPTPPAAISATPRRVAATPTS